MVLAWLHWNPEKNIFTLPILDHPVAWYGFFFVLGFFFGYFIVIRMLASLLSNTKTLTFRDVASWPKLVSILHYSHQNTDHALHVIIKKLDPETSTRLQNLQLGQDIDFELKQKILKGLNNALEDPDCHLTRDNIDTFMPGAISSVKDLSMSLTDKLTWFIIIGTIVGARLGHVFFYEWPFYQNHLLDIFKVWHGGLASHGGAIGVIIAIIAFVVSTRKQFPELNFMKILDIVVIPTALVGCLIRIGNFFNQEILGTETDLPWAVIFDRPADLSEPVPRHPVQLYESLTYLFTFIVLITLWKKSFKALGSGFYSGLFFVLVFGSRFFIEFLKERQGLMIDESFLQTGQYLSVPFIAIGALLLYKSRKV